MERESAHIVTAMPLKLTSRYVVAFQLVADDAHRLGVFADRGAFDTLRRHCRSEEAGDDIETIFFEHIQVFERIALALQGHRLHELTLGIEHIKGAQRSLGEVARAGRAHHPDGTCLLYTSPSPRDS